MPNYSHGRATNPLVSTVQMSISVNEFVPGGSTFTPNAAPVKPPAAQTSLSVNTKEFVPSGGAVKQGMNSQAPTFQPQAPAPAPAPAPAKPAKPVQPPKEKAVLLLERIVKGSNTDIKSEEVSNEDTEKVNQLKEPLTEVKKDSKCTVQLLRNFCDVMKSVVKLPENIVKMSVHQRLITRGDDGEPQQLAGGKKQGREQWRDNDKPGRGRGRGGGYNDNYQGGQGRGRGRHNENNGFQTGAHGP